MDKNFDLFDNENRKNPFIETGTESKKENTLPDKERFIKKAFETDPEKGIELLFRTHYKCLCSHAVRFVYSKELAEDLVGEVFERFWKKQLYRQVSSSFQAYLFTAVRHQAYQYLRSEFGGKKVVPVDKLLIESSHPSPLQILQYDEVYLEIEKTINLLSPPIQRVFLLSRFEGKKNSDIAQELQISIKTVEAHITKVLKLLRKALPQQLVNALILFSISLIKH